MKPSAVCTLLLFIFSISIITGCISQEEQKTETGNKNYNLYVLGKDNKEYLLPTNSLDTGVLNPEQNGIELNDLVNRELIVKNNVFYHLKRKTNRFSKYLIKDSKLSSINALPMNDFSIENFYWINQDTLLLVGLDNSTYTKPRYYKITAANFKIVQEGNLEIPKPFGIYNSSSIGFVTLHNNKLLVAYTFHNYQETMSYSSSDTIYMASLSYPEMKLESIDKDTRSAYPGGINTIQPYSFTTENGDFYYMSCPGIAMGNIPEKPTAIFRIKKQESKIDRSYFFNLLAKTDNHAYGMWYLGDNKALIRSERKDLYKSSADHHSTYHFEYYVVDLIKHTRKKLSLPLDKGTRKASVIVKNREVYIAVDSSSKGHFIWIYNIDNQRIRKGAELTGNTSFILRIDEK